MKAILLKKAGDVENLVFKEIEQPKPKENEVLVEIKAISVNPVDFKVRGNEESLTMIYGKERPAILGWDIAGIVKAKGDKVTEFEIGDRVFGMINFVGKGNAYAEYVVASQDHIAKIPTQISYEEAAATTLAALTALQVLQNTIKKDDRVLIHAGSGGVGHFAIQIAKAIGAHVITTSSGKNKEFVMSLGADEHIDYKTQVFQDVVKDVDFVFDMFNGDILFNSVKVVKEGGKIITIIPTPEFSEEILDLAKTRNVDVSFLMVQSSAKDMNTLSKFLDKGDIKPHVSKTFAFNDMAKAHKQLESGRTVGKVVVTLIN